MSLKAVLFLSVLSALLTLYAGAQQPIDSPDSAPPAPMSAAAAVSDKLPHPNERYFLKHLALDQAAIWTSPAHISRDDLEWLPLSVLSEWDWALRTPVGSSVPIQAIPVLGLVEGIAAFRRSDRLFSRSITCRPPPQSVKRGRR